MRKRFILYLFFTTFLFGLAKSNDITISVSNVNGMQPSGARVVLYNPNFESVREVKYTNTFGQVTFSLITNGTYPFEVYYKPDISSPFSANEEFWGRGDAIVSNTSPSIYNFVRNQPYISVAPHFSPANIQLGQNSNFTVTITNRLPYATASEVSIWVDRDQSNPFDLTAPSARQQVSAFGTSIFNIPSIAPNHTGSYKCYVIVKSLVVGTSNYTVTDQYNWTTAFTVTCPILATPTTPFPGTSSAPGPVLDDLQPTFQWSGNSNGYYHVQIWDAATTNPTNSNVIYGYETPFGSPGHCILGLSHALASGVLQNNQQYKWSVHRNDPCGECESSNTALMYFQTPSNCTPPSILLQPSSQYVICNNNPVTLSVGAQGTNLSYKWQQYSNSNWVDVGENSSTFVTGIENSYRCIVSGDCGLPQTSNVAVVSNGGNCTGPQARFTISPTSITAGQSVNFTNQSTSSTSVSWNIERVQSNGATAIYETSTANNFSLSFLAPGCYKVTLTASNGSTTDTKTSPLCYLSVLPNTGNVVPENVAFDKNYYTGKGGDPVMLATGSFDMSIKDLSVHGINTEVILERRYLSKNTDIGPFGKGWSFEYGSWIDVSNPYEWQLHHGDGHTSYHIPFQDGDTKSKYQGMYDRLYYSVNNGEYTYTYQEKNGIKWNYRGNGKLLSRVDLDGNETAFGYNGNNLTSITAPGGRFINLSYNAQNRIITATANSGLQVHYYYNADATLLDSVNIGSSTTKFKYDSYGLTEVNDPNGSRVVKNVYNGNAQVVEQYDAYDNSTFFQYDFPAALHTTVTNAQQKRRVVKHDNNYHLIESADELNNKRLYSFNASGLLETVTNELSNKKKLEYDENNNLNKVIDEKNYYDSIAYGVYARPTHIRDKEGNVTTTVYTSTGHPKLITLPNGGIIQFLYNQQGQDTLIIDAKGNVTRKEYYPNGDLHKIIKPTSVSAFTYDLQGRVSSITNGKGYTTSFEYNYFDQVKKITDPMGYVSSFEYDLNGNLISSKDKEENVTRREYDAKDRLTKLIEPYNHITSFFYDSLNRTVKIRDANGKAKLLEYDDAGRLISTSDSLLGILKSYTYDSAGNITTITDGRGKKWNIKYDERNLPVTYINPLQKQKKLAYNGAGQIVQSIDELGRSTYWTYNTLGLPAVVTDAYNKTVKHFYDLNGNAESIEDAMHNILQWTYDSDNRIKTFNEGYGTHTTTWDSAGNMVSYKDPDNKLTEFFYNPNNENIKRAYDGKALKEFTLSKNGWIKEATNTIGTIKFIRDAYGSVLQKIGFYNDTLSYKRDSVGNITVLNYGKGKKLTYTYNSLNQSTSVTDWNNNVYLIYRNQDGSIDSLVYPNTNRIKVTRDDAGRVATWKVYLSSNPSSLLVTDSLLRNDVGEIIANPPLKLLYPVIPEQSNNGKYNPTDRIAVYGTTNFQTGNNGNIITTNSPQFSNTYSYESNGNTFNGNLASYTHNGIQQTNSFDAFNNRIRIANKSTFSVDEELARRPIVLSEMNDGSGYTFKALTIYSPEGMLLARDSSGVIQYLLPDVNGNIIALTNSSSVVTDTYATDPFGDYYTHTGTSTQPFTFLGMYGLQRDTSGLYYDWARYYDAHTGRFLSKDPYPINSLRTQAINRFSYGLNNPTSFVDVDGMKPANIVADFDFDAEYKRNANWWQRFANSSSGANTIKVLNGVITGATLGVDVISTYLGTPSFGVTYNGLIALITNDPNRYSAFLVSATLPNLNIGNYSNQGRIVTAPDFIVSEGGTIFPVPKGAVGPVSAQSGKGFQFIGGSGGNGLNSKVTGFRFMDPVTIGKHQYPNGYGSYSNKIGQTIDPLTGQIIERSNPWWHISAK